VLFLEADRDGVRFHFFCSELLLRLLGSFSVVAVVSEQLSQGVQYQCDLFVHGSSSIISIVKKQQQHCSSSVWRSGPEPNFSNKNSS